MPAIGTDQAPPGDASASGAPRSKVEAAGELLGDEHRLAAGDAVPGVGGTRDERPVVAIGRAVAEPVELDRPVAVAGRGVPDRQGGGDLGTRLEPAGDGGGLGVVVAGEVELGREALVEVGEEGEAEAVDHGADADVDREREEQRHQRQREAAERLARVGPGPFRQRAAGARAAEGEDAAEERGKGERGRQQQAAQHGEAGGEAAAEDERGDRDEGEDDRSGEAQADGAALGGEPGLRLGRGEDRQGDRAPEAGAGGGERAREADAEAGDPPGRDRG